MGEGRSGNKGWRWGWGGQQLLLLHVTFSAFFFISGFQKIKIKIKPHSYKQAASSIIFVSCLNKKKKKKL